MNTTPNTPNAAERPSDWPTEADIAKAQQWIGSHLFPSSETERTILLALALLKSAEDIADSRHPAESVSAEPVAWTTRQPTEPGVYRVRGFSINDKSRTGVVEVRHGDGALICNIHRENTDPDLTNWYSVADLNPAFEWQRLHHPSTPGAVSDEDALVAQLRGRALFLRKLGRVKSPSLMERAADALESFAKRSAAEQFPSSVPLDIAREEIAELRSLIRKPTCRRCGASSSAEAETKCRPDGDDCPGCNFPLEQLWELAAPPAQAVSEPKGWRLEEGEKRAVIVCGMGKRVWIEFGDSLWPFFRKMLSAAPAAATREGME